MGSSLTADEEEGSASETNFITGEPVDIPAPVAKGIDGIDPASVTFTASSGSASLQKALFKTATDASVGTLEADLLGDNDALVGLVVDGEFADIQTSSSLHVSFNLQNNLIDQSLALVVLSETSSADSVDSVSAPVIVIVNSPDDESDNFTVTVSLTNIDEGSSEFSLAITPDPIALSSNGLVAIQGLDADNTRWIATFNLLAGEYTLLSNEFTNGLKSLEYHFDDDQLVAVNPDDFTVETINLLGTNNSGDFNNGETFRAYCISPDEQWIANNRHDTFSDNEIMVLQNLVSPSALNVNVQGGEPAPIVNMACAWVDNQTLALKKSYNDGTHTIQIYSFGADLETFDPDLPINIIPSVAVPLSLTKIGTMVLDPNNSERLYYTCDNAGSMGICMADANLGNSELLNMPGINFESLAITSDSQQIIMAGTTGAFDATFANSRLYTLNTGDLSVTSLMKGFNPILSTTSNTIYYLTYVEEKIQLSLLNLDRL